MRAYKNNNNCTIRNKESTRPWQHVLDPINGYIKLAEMLGVSKNKIYESAWNFGPNNKSKKVIDVVKTVQTIIPIKIKYLTKNPESFKETKKLSLNSDKARKFLKWKNRINFDDTIKLTIEWHLNQVIKKVDADYKKTNFKNYKLMAVNKSHKILLVFFLNLIYFIVGFVYQHDFSNGGKIDFEHIYGNFLLFKNSSLFELDWTKYGLQVYLYII